MFVESIDTDRFVLRVPKATDGPAVYDAVTDVIEQLGAWPKSWPWAVQTQSVTVSTAHCERARENFERGHKWSLFVFDRSSEQVVGNAEFHTIHSEANIWELGFWTRPSRQHCGVMSEALTAVLAWMNLINPNIEIIVKIDSRNKISRQLATKVGLKSVGFYQIDGYMIEILSSNPRS
jgi:RimJ/RimL family protein N-acetyltransferase